VALLTAPTDHSHTHSHSHSHSHTCSQKHSQPPHTPHLGAGQPELGEAHQVGEEDAGDGRHGPAAVGQLGLDEPLEVLGVGALGGGWGGSWSVRTRETHAISSRGRCG